MTFEIQNIVKVNKVGIVRVLDITVRMSFKRIEAILN